MTTGGFRVTALRVKLPCEDEKDFYARLADTIAEKGLRVPTANLRPVGTRVRVILEFRDTRTLSGEGIVDAHVEGPRPTMNVRLVKFERSQPGAGAAPATTPPPRPAVTPPPRPAATPPPRRAPTPPSRPAATPAREETAAPTPLPTRAVTPVAKLAVVSVPTPVPVAKAATPGAAPAVRSTPAAGTPHVAEPATEPAEYAEPAEAVSSQEPERVAAPDGAAAEPSSPAAAPETSFASLMDEAIDEEEARQPQAVATALAEGTEQLEPLYGASAATEPTPPPQPAAARTGGALPVASRRAALAAVAAAAVLAIALLAYAVARRPAAPPPDPAVVAADAEAQLVSRIANADRRMAEGRLSGPDGALEHLLAAKALKADDARVKDRLRLLADTLEMLGGRALQRGDATEAEVHLSAALQADPERQSISDKLRAVGRSPVAPDARSGPGTAEKAP